jgi:hypothetical protein
MKISILDNTLKVHLSFSFSFTAFDLKAKVVSILTDTDKENNTLKNMYYTKAPSATDFIHYHMYESHVNVTGVKNVFCNYH